jgi:hypothetical protein
MLSGTRDRTPSHATAEIANTARPPITIGDVTAAAISDPPAACARAVATCIPCFNRSCPPAASRTANSSSPMLVMVMCCLLSVRGGAARSVDIAIRRLR